VKEKTRDSARNAAGPGGGQAEETRARRRAGGGLKRADLAIIAVVLAIALGAAAGSALLRGSGDRGALSVEIYEEGALTETLSLREDQDLRFESRWGYNRVRVEGGSVRVLEADCASQTCVHSGAIKRAGDMIACLPHRLVIKLRGEGAEADAVAY
jgi:hypothetical protein